MGPGHEELMDASFSQHVFKRLFLFLPRCFWTMKTQFAEWPGASLISGKEHLVSRTRLRVSSKLFFWMPEQPVSLAVPGFRSTGIRLFRSLRVCGREV